YPPTTCLPHHSRSSHAGDAGPSACPAPPPPLLSPLSLHDALPIFHSRRCIGRHPARLVTGLLDGRVPRRSARRLPPSRLARERRSEEHTSELQSRFDLVCRLLLEKKKSERRQRRQRWPHDGRVALR